MGTPYLGEIRAFTFGDVPKGWAACNGQLLAINQNQALFALLGTTYGGNGVTDFALPDLQARSPMHVDSTFPQGQKGGETNHTLTAAEMAAHTHVPTARSVATTTSPQGATWGPAPAAAYTATVTGAMNTAALGASTGGQPHSNQPPYLVITFGIALQGIFPSHS